LYFFTIATIQEASDVEEKETSKQEVEKNPDAAEKANNKVIRVGAELYRHNRKRCEPLWSRELK
jgi:hypothetical protein